MVLAREFVVALPIELNREQQIELLQALLDQQKRQNALLRRLCEANAPEKEDVAEPTVAGKAKGEDEFIRLVAER